MAWFVVSCWVRCLWGCALLASTGSFKKYHYSATKMAQTCFLLFVRQLSSLCCGACTFITSFISTSSLQILKTKIKIPRRFKNPREKCEFWRPVVYCHHQLLQISFSSSFPAIQARSWSLFLKFLDEKLSFSLVPECGLVAFESQFFIRRGLVWMRSRRLLWS